MNTRSRLRRYILFMFLASSLTAQEPPACKVYLTFSMLSRDQTLALFNKATADELAAWVVAGQTDCETPQTISEELVIAEMTKLGLNPQDRESAGLVAENRDGQDGTRRVGRFLLDGNNKLKDASLMGTLLRSPSVQRYIPLASWVMEIAGDAIMGQTPDTLKNFQRLSEPHEMIVTKEQGGAMRAWTRRWADETPITRHVEIVRK